ncbi:hypothetical protein C8R45DRAFT_933872 [Mycena sanguinolenta]|nr:hypothetical protein C8R45DRAFT_933872 [Mycena sanguinolenta]
MDFQAIPQTIMDFVYMSSFDSGQVLLLLPACATAFSASILLLHYVFSLKPVNDLLARLGIPQPATNVPIPGIGSGVILGFRVARAIGCFGLLVLSGFPFNDGPLEVMLRSTPYLYTSALALLSTSPKNTRHGLIRHVNCILFLLFCVYVCRDFVPLLTFTGVPVDLDEGRRLWAKIAFLFVTGIIIPLFTPRQYIPVDPLYMDIFSGSNARRHLFFGLMRIFYREFIILAFLLVFRVVTNYSGYIETRDDPGAHIIGLSHSRRTFSSTLRIRMKAETTHVKDTPPPAVELSPQTGSDTESTAETATPENAGSSARSEDDSGSTTMKASSSSIKSTSTASKPQPKPAADKAKKLEGNKSGGSLVGKINNLVTVDLGNITDSRDFLILLISVPLQLALGVYFLHVLLGWAVWVGVASILLLAPLPGYMANLVRRVQKERLKRTDERVQSVTEAVNVLRMVCALAFVSSPVRSLTAIKIKLFGWEEKMKTRIGDKRDEELVWIRKRRFIDLASGLVNFLIPVVTMTFTYATYMTVFDILRVNIAQISGWLNYLMTGKVSVYFLICSQILAASYVFQLDRVNEFLKKTELLDAFDDKGTAAVSTSDSSLDERIGFRNATFTWSNESDGPLPLSQGRFQLKIDNELLFRRDRINLVIGPTGSGDHVSKSLLEKLIGPRQNLAPHGTVGCVDAFFSHEHNAPDDSSPGEMHFIPSSLDSWYNLPRHSGIAYAAQESWVLNETIRSNIIFDTPFDEERYKKVLHQCALEPDLELFQAGDQTEVGEKARFNVVGRTKGAPDAGQGSLFTPLNGSLRGVLATHNIALTRPIADFMVTFGADGRIHSQGTISEITQRGSLAAQIDQDQQVLDKKQQELDIEDPVADQKPAEGKLILAEEVELGHVSNSSLTMYFSAMGGKHPVFFFVFYFGGCFFYQIFVTLRSWQLGYWAKQYDDRPAKEVDVVFRHRFRVDHFFVHLRASRIIHKTLIDSVLSAPLRWLDVTPASRIIVRVTNDVRTVDDPLATQLFPLTSLIVSMITQLGAVVIYVPIFFFPGAFVGAVGAWVGQIYISGQLPVKRFMSNTRAPVLAHFGAAIAGLVSVRAFGAQAKFTTESLSRIDRYTRAARNFYNLNRIRLILFPNFSILIIALGNSLERIQGYINIEHEKPATEAGKPPAYWPGSGDLRVENLSARYSEDGPKVLHDLSFHVKAEERIGIVGRTGSGKSSLTLALLGCIPTEGSVRYDGIETSELNLDALRSSITIIPQVPELLSGSLRANLDPFGQCNDAELNYALRAAGLFALQNEMDEGRITLDSAISDGGSNLSVGQRQIFALARAIVRKSKILILDEDYKTDSIIQNSLREELRGDVSLLTVAHRLQTIMDADKIMVLDAGRLVEFDSPKELLKIKDGKLRALVEESDDREALYTMAGAE